MDDFTILNACSDPAFLAILCDDSSRRHKDKKPQGENDDNEEGVVSNSLDESTNTETKNHWPLMNSFKSIVWNKSDSSLEEEEKNDNDCDNDSTDNKSSSSRSSQQEMDGNIVPSTSAGSLSSQDTCQGIEPPISTAKEIGQSNSRMRMSIRRRVDSSLSSDHENNYHWSEHHQFTQDDEPPARPPPMEAFMALKSFQNVYNTKSNMLSPVTAYNEIIDMYVFLNL